MMHIWCRECVECAVGNWNSCNIHATYQLYISGHTALPRTTTYQEVVVDSVTHVAAITIAVTLFPAIGYRAIHSSPMQKECGWYQI